MYETSFNFYFHFKIFPMNALQFLFFETGSMKPCQLCRPGLPQTHRYPPVSTSRMLELKAYPARSHPGVLQILWLIIGNLNMVSWCLWKCNGKDTGPPHLLFCKKASKQLVSSAHSCINSRLHLRPPFNQCYLLSLHANSVFPFDHQHDNLALFLE